MQIAGGWLRETAVVVLSMSAGVSMARAQATKIRWDITDVQPGAAGAPPSIFPGGFASAWAQNTAGAPRLKMTLTGSGTFAPWDPTDVTGGGQFFIGRWNASLLRFEELTSGTFTATELVSFHEAPNRFPTGIELDPRLGVGKRCRPLKHT